jgi:hypothetical protein
MRSVIIWAMCVVAAMSGVYAIKYHVLELERQLRLVSNDIRSTEESLHVLSAEWAYLNRPDRLAELAKRHLEMEAIEGVQVAELDSLPFPDAGEQGTYSLASGQMVTPAASPVAATQQRAMRERDYASR